MTRDPAPGGRSLLITGASTGIGLACATRFASEGWRVFAGVRRTGDADRLSTTLGPTVVPLILEVTDADQVAAAAQRIEEVAGAAGLAGLVNNAGISVAGPLEYLPIGEFRRQLEVNVTGQLAVTQAVLPMLRRARGRIVMISSISGRSALPMVGAYAASKFALEALSDTLRLELRRWDIDVALIEPGRIETPIWEKSIARAEANLDVTEPGLMENYGELIEAARRMVQRKRGSGTPVAEVVDAVAHALTAERPRIRYLIGRDARMRLRIEWLPDRLRDWLVARQLRKLRKRYEAGLSASGP